MKKVNELPENATWSTHICSSFFFNPPTSQTLKLLLSFVFFYIHLPEEHEVQKPVAVFFVPLAVRFLGAAAVVRRVRPNAVLHT